MAEIILDQTNPVYNTAKLTLSVLGRAGVPEAVDFAQRLGFSDIRKSFNVNENNKSELPQAILQETRYEFLNRVIRESGCKNVVDIACGFSPRGYVMAKEGYHYRGIDLEASVEALSKMADGLNREGLTGSLRYIACDLTDPDAFVKALEDLEGEVLIVCEGLMLYLEPYEGRSLFQGLYRALSVHGGRFVTPDFELRSIYEDVHTALLGQEEGMRTFLAVAESVRSQSDNKWKKSIADRDAEPEKIMAEENLTAERIAYYTDSENCRVFEQLESGAAEKLRSLLRTCRGWSVAVNKDQNRAAHAEQKAVYGGAYKAEYSVEDGELKIKLFGRVDSITSGSLLATYNEIRESETFASVTIDGSCLSYISSAGLRVLLIIKKDLPQGTVSVKNAAPNIREIFETTGFDSIVSM